METSIDKVIVIRNGKAGMEYSSKRYAVSSTLEPPSLKTAAQQQISLSGLQKQQQQQWLGWTGSSTF